MKFKFNDKVIVDKDQPSESFGFIIGFANCKDDEEYMDTYVIVRLEHKCQGYLVLDEPYSNKSEPVRRRGFISTIVVHPDNLNVVN